MRKVRRSTRAVEHHQFQGRIMDRVLQQIPILWKILLPQGHVCPTGKKMTERRGIVQEVNG